MGKGYTAFGTLVCIMTSHASCTSTSCEQPRMHIGSKWQRSATRAYFLSAMAACIHMDALHMLRHIRHDTAVSSRLHWSLAI
jgi:hypothetical protein